MPLRTLLSGLAYGCYAAYSGNGVCPLERCIAAQLTQVRLLDDTGRVSSCESRSGWWSHGWRGLARKEEAATFPVTKQVGPVIAVGEMPMSAS
jgi:hypothetical protein